MDSVQLRSTAKSDLAAIKALHATSGYEHTLAPDSTLLSGFVATLDGEVIAWVGCEPAIQAFFLTNTRELSPALRVEALKLLAMKLAEHVTGAMPWVKGAFVWVDSNYPKTAKRLIQMGFTKPAGELLEMTRARALGILAYLKGLAA